MEHSSNGNLSPFVKTQGNLELNYFLFSNMASFFCFFVLFFFASRITPDAPIGLWTLSPPSSAVLPHPEPTIPFSYWSAVSHPKTRDFRFPEPAIPFYHWSAVSHPKTRDLPISNHFRSCDFRFWS